MQKSKIETNKKIKRKAKHISYSRLFAVLFVFLVFILGLYKLTMIGVEYYRGDIDGVLSEKDIAKRIASHIKIPNEDISSVLRVKDPETFEKESVFYKGIEKGDYIILYPSLAVIYDQKSDTVLRTMELNP